MSCPSDKDLAEAETNTMARELASALTLGVLVGILISLFLIVVFG